MTASSRYTRLCLFSCLDLNPSRWRDHGRVFADVNVNAWDFTDAIADLVRSDKPIEEARLQDPTVPVVDLLRGAHDV